MKKKLLHKIGSSGSRNGMFFGPEQKLLLIISLMFSLSACKEVPYFSGEISTFSDFEKKVQLKGEKIELADVYTGTMSVYDTLLIFTADNFEDNKMLHVFGTHCKKELGSFCMQGRGPEEYTDISYYDQFQRINGDIKLWMSDVWKEQIELLNLTQSLKKQEIQIDRTFPLNWLKKWQSPMASFFMLDTNMCLYRNLNEYLYKNKGKYMLGEYRFCLDSIENELKSYSLFNRPLLNHNPQVEARYLLSSMDRIKPDGSKVAMAMVQLQQLNIMDVQTGEIKGYRLKDSPDFEYLEGPLKDLKYFYIDLGVDNNYIYALCLNCFAEDFPIESNLIHIFDWNGKPVCEVVTDQRFFGMAFDPVNGLIYGKNFMEEIYCYDIRSVLKE